MSTRASAEVGPALDWLVIGGGLHGVHVAARLIAEGGVAADRLRLLDPAPALLERWRSCTAVTGMRHLRSPSVHHLDLHPFALQRFAGERKYRASGLFAAPYERPSLELFNAHCDEVIDRFGLGALHLRDRAAEILPGPGGVRVTTAGGAALEAARVVLALGASEQPSWPAWAPRGLAQVQHIFTLGPGGWPAAPGEAVAVVGGGISAVQVALRLRAEGQAVHLICRHELREHQFDSDPGWLGPRFMAGFARERDWGRRRALIQAARHRGSVPADLLGDLRRAVGEGLDLRRAGVEGLEQRGERLELRLQGGARLEVDRVLLATGASPQRPGGALIDGLVTAASLPCAACGYPILDAALRWHPRVHVTGPLAELELGPTARNIAGARRAADRLIAALRGKGARPIGSAA